MAWLRSRFVGKPKSLCAISGSWRGAGKRTVRSALRDIDLRLGGAFYRACTLGPPHERIDEDTALRSGLGRNDRRRRRRVLQTSLLAPTGSERRYRPGVCGLLHPVRRWAVVAIEVARSVRRAGERAGKGRPLVTADDVRRLC